MIRSIRARVLLAASAALIGFLGLTGVALDRAFRSSAESSVRDYLQTQVYGLLAAAELTPRSTLKLPGSLPEPRLSRTNTGLFAWVRDAGGEVIWKSPSTLGTGLARRASPPAGEFRFRRTSTEAGEAVFVISYSVIWETGGGAELPFVFSVAEDFASYQSRVNTFRRTLWTWLLGVVVVLVVVQLTILMWLLRPLRTIAREIAGVEQGEREGLSTDYPDELRSLALNLNALLSNERNRRQRYRDKLDDLAHSLKTPLTVLRNLAERPDSRDSQSLREVADQVERMQSIISYQLQSATSRREEFSLAHPVKPEIEKIARSLEKAYHDRNIRISIDVDDRHRFRGDVGDFMEIMGNLMDNACKYCSGRVSVTSADGDPPNELAVAVEDDGPGIPESERGGILGRRVRGDARAEGQGIGLAVVNDIASAYGGAIEIGTAELGGARIVVRLPGTTRP